MTLKNTDSYKLSHKGFMNEGTTLIYSNLTPRSLRLMPRIPGIENPDVVMFGLQYFIKDFLINEWNRDFFSKPKSEVVGRFKRLTDAYLGLDSVPSEHFEQLHDLGYLPIKVKALREGTKLQAQIPVLTIYNTHKDFAWLTNYLETVLSSELWKPITVASIMYNWRKIVNDFAVKTTGSTNGTEFQLHDFSSRGMSGRHDSAICGAAFLLSSCGTDTVPAISLIEDYYNTDITEEFVATSVPATEHMISCLGTAVEGELESYRKWITQDYPTGIVSLVSDTYDYFKVLTEYLPQLKDDILARPVNALGLSKTVVRPDCYSDDTSILTNHGWKFFKDLTNEDLVAQVLDDDSYEFVKPLNIINQQYDGKMYLFSDFHGKVDLLVTPEHRMIYKHHNKDKVIFEKTTLAKDMPNRGNWKSHFLRSSKAQSKNKKLTPKERLDIVFQADGSYTTTGNNIRFSFSKGRKKDRLLNILHDNNIEYREYDLKDGSVEYVVLVNGNDYHKDFSWVDVENLCSDWANEFIEEIKHWDSSIRNSGRFKYDTTNKSCADVVELIAVAAGKGVLVSCSEDNRKEHFSDVYTLHIMDNNRAGGQSWKKEEVDYSGNVHCVTVPSGKILVKRNRCILVSGNSGDPVDIICGDDIYETNIEDLNDDRDELNHLIDSLVFNDKIDIGVSSFLIRNNGVVCKVTVDRFMDSIGGIDILDIEENYERTPEEKGSIEILWEIFGGTTTEQGYKLLDSHIGLIYGDSMTPERVHSIMTKLVNKGFATTNVVFGVGSYSLQYLTRDSLGMAVKATYAEVNGKGYSLSKDPITDSGVKKSARGLLSVARNCDKLELLQDVDWETEETGELVDVFENGRLLIDEKYTDIRNRLWSAN